MALAIADVEDLIALLRQHPEWVEPLRRTLLADDFLALPRIVGELAEAQQRTERRVGELTEAQQRTERRVGELAEAQ